jgi:hypothetical protein
VINAEDPLASFEGRLGGKLRAVSAADGKTLSRCELASPPVFDGMAAANGRLYLSAMDGHLRCYGNETGGRKRPGPDVRSRRSRATE